MSEYAPQDPLLDASARLEEADQGDGLDYELQRPHWRPVPLSDAPGWRVRDWTERPLRFVDGKDSGTTVTWLQAPGGYPIPVRLSQIGGIVVRVEDGRVLRERSIVEPVVSMVIDPFPWDEVEDFARALPEHGLRLLPAKPPGGQPSYDFEQMRKAAQNRSNDEMAVLEESVLGADRRTPAIVDGRLEPRSGGFDQATTPVAGVVKTHRKNYLHPLGWQLLYRLEPGERTPAFHIRAEGLPVVSWYLRLAGSAAAMPNWGVVRVELPFTWFDARRNTDGWDYIERLCRLLCAYRCRDPVYERADVSLHPVVRAEQLLEALFRPRNQLQQRFYHIAGL